jgi:hypothetical protein
MSLRDFPELFKHLPQHKPWVITISVISVVVVLGLCGFSSWLLLGHGDDPIGLPTNEPTAEHRDISTRDVDATPMTAADAFPVPEIPAAVEGYPPYVMMGGPEVSDDCSRAADGEVRRLITAGTCSQLLRASFSSYDNNYFVTAGILNLTNETDAGSMRGQIQGLIGSGQGRFLGYVSVPNGNDQLYSAPPNIAIRVKGHFMLYTVVVRQDGADMPVDDPGAAVVVFDVLTTYLLDTVMEKWSVVPGSVPDPSATTDPAGTETTAAAG